MEGAQERRGGCGGRVDGCVEEEEGGGQGGREGWSDGCVMGDKQGGREVGKKGRRTRRQSDEVLVSS